MSGEVAGPRRSKSSQKQSVPSPGSERYVILPARPGESPTLFWGGPFLDDLEDEDLKPLKVVKQVRRNGKWEVV
jgi:hypothetical protein